MLDALHEHARDGLGIPVMTSLDASSQQVIAMAHHDPGSRTVSFILGDTAANVAIHAITAQAVDREARMREVTQYSQNFPEGSYGRRNRQAIADHESRIAERLRAVERAYRTAVDHEPMAALEPTDVTGPVDGALDHELELE